MFNALNGLGAAGQVDSSVQANALVALYTTFAFVGFIAGTGLNYFGAKATLGFGGLGYALYSASFLSYNHTQNSGFVIFAGAMLGVCAGFLWTAQGAVMMSYPTEGEKGRYIGLFWAIFNMGAVIGSISPIVQNWDRENNTPVNDGTYVAFLVLMCCGAVLAFFLVPPEKIVRKDGTRVQKVRMPTVASEVLGLWETLRSDTYILALFPLFWASNWFYTYQQNCYNLFLFTVRGRAFTNIWYWLAQIFGALAFGTFLDYKGLSRRNRAIGGWVILFAVVNIIWGCGSIIDTRYHNERILMSQKQTPNINVGDRDFVGLTFLYVFYGVLDAMWQTYAYWVMGALSNDPRKLAYFAGFYKGIQSAGAAVVWRLDALGYSFVSIFASSWALCAAGLVCAAPVIWYKIRETEVTQEDFVEGEGKLAEFPAAAQQVEAERVRGSSLEKPGEAEHKETTA